MFIPTKFASNDNTKHSHFFFYVEVMLLKEHDKIEVKLHIKVQWIQDNYLVY